MGRKWRSPEWEMGILWPIYKNKGDLLDPKSYRPLCLLDVSYKPLASIISARMNPHIRDMLKEQCGCLLKKSARDAVFNIKRMLQLRKEHDFSSYTLFVDLVKAFDIIDHDLMFAALKKYGFPDPLINVIK